MDRVPGVFATSFDPPRERVGTAVLVPGRGYPPAAPLLFFTGMALLQHGWRVEQHWWDPPAHESDEQTSAWVRAEVIDVFNAPGPFMIVGKSLGTLAAPVAAERALPAIWLTPLLGMPEVAGAVAANPAPQLLVGGTADDLWDSRVAHELESENCTVVEIPEADHVLMVPGDSVRGILIHAEVQRAVDTWLAAAHV